MRFRPCIDIHNGKVKQIIGSRLQDKGDVAAENFVSENDSAYYSALFKEKHLTGGHVIMLNSRSSEFYEATKDEALRALRSYPGGLQAGGGIDPGNADVFLDAGASHIIVTSCIFDGPKLSFPKLEEIRSAAGKEHLVLDLSCRKKPYKGTRGSAASYGPGDSENYYVVTDRWQTFTDAVFNEALMKELSGYCSEFLIHGVDVEGKKQGIDEELLKILSLSPIPVTYAGGVSSFEHIDKINLIGSGKIDVTIGSALSIFGGDMDFDEVTQYILNSSV